MASEERLDTNPVASGFPDAYQYGFYRLVYLLERLGTGAPVGRLGPPSQEPIRFHSDTSLGFPTGDLSRSEVLDTPDGATALHVYSTFLGLFGPSSPMPSHFVEEMASDAHQGQRQEVRDFLDAFHHRILSLLFRVWSKYRPPVEFQSRGEDQFSKLAFCTVGLDAFGNATPTAPKFLLLRYAHLQSLKTRPLYGLTGVLEELFPRLTPRVEPFAERWALLEEPFRAALGSRNCTLGRTMTIGSFMRDRGGQIRIELGPLEYDDYVSLLPGGRRRGLLQQVVRTFGPGHLLAQLRLRMLPGAAPRYSLGSPKASTLGQTAWVGGNLDEFVLDIPLFDSDLPMGAPSPPPL